MTTVMLVDDDAETLAAWQATCASQGYATQIAANGQDALAVMRDAPVDVVVADWRMPVMSGSVLCLRMRNEPAFAGIVFILVSGEPSPPAFVQYDGFLRKPVDVAELLSMMDRLLLDQKANRLAHRRAHPRNE